jgi:hypothetical protein
VLRLPGKWVSIAVLPLLAMIASASPAKEDVRHSLKQGGRHMELQISAQFTPAMQQNIVAWIEFISDALLQVYGRWPRQQWQVSVTPTSAGSDPIPWAQVHRGDINRVEFFTAAEASQDSLKNAWTGYHELAHLLIPYQGWGDAWFSEGLASYYQNILQARAGILTEQQMWQKLYEGYQRARLETQFDGRTLRSVSSKLRQEGGFMRVYWSGAWYFLAADTRLRQQSGGRHTLDQALEKLNLCCGEQHMAVPGMVQQLDELNRVLLFQPLYDEVSDSLQVPPYEPIFASMGITVLDGQVQLQQEGPGARLRRQIVQHKPL